MAITLATFNLNNLFSRWDFKASYEDAQKDPARLLQGGEHRVRTYRGVRIKEKKAAERQRIAARILAMAPDVLAVQEVEDKFTLDSFNADDLGGRFPHRALVEGNDPRFIDVGLMSRLPLGEVRSYQHWVHPERPNERVFRRDLLAAEVLSEDRRRTLFWVLVAHLKSQYVDWRVKGEAQRRRAENQSLATRRFEAEAIATIVRERIGDAVPVFVCGDLNDHPGSPALQPLLGKGRKCLGMVNLVARDQAEGERWTTSHKETGVEREFTQLDYVLVGERFAGLVAGARVVRRATRVTQADGSDHDPVVCEIDA